RFAIYRLSLDCTELAWMTARLGFDAIPLRIETQPVDGEASLTCAVAVSEPPRIGEILRLPVAAYSSNGERLIGTRHPISDKQRDQVIASLLAWEVDVQLATVASFRAAVVLND